MSKPARVTMKVLKDIDFGKFDELKRRINAGKYAVRVGVPSGETEEDGTPLTIIAVVNEYGSPAQGIPERPFMRVAMQRNLRKYIRLNRINLVKMVRGQMTANQALGLLGEIAKGDIQTEIRTGQFKPLNPKTIAARRRARSSGYNQSLRRKVGKKTGAGPIDRPLIDTGQLIQSIQWEIE